MTIKQESKKAINVERRNQIGVEKKARTRALIIKVAFELLGTKEGLFFNIDDICKKASISRGTFYNYFSSPANLIDSVSYELSHIFNTSVQQVMSRMPSGPERASSAIRYYLGHACTDNQWGWGMVHISSYGPIFGKETYEHALQTIREGMDSKFFNVSDVEVGCNILLGSSYAAMVTLLTNKQCDIYPELVVRQILLGLGVDEKIVNSIIKKELPVITY